MTIGQTVAAILALLTLVSKQQTADAAATQSALAALSAKLDALSASVAALGAKVSMIEQDLGIPETGQFNPH